MGLSMEDAQKTKAQLFHELTALRQHVTSLESRVETLQKNEDFYRTSAAQYRESEWRYRSLAEGSIQAISVLNREGIRLFVNPSYVAMFGFDDPQELLGKPVRERIALQDRERLHQSSLARYEGREAPTHYTYQGIWKDSSLIWLQAMATLIHWDDQPCQLITMMDITEQKQAEDALRQRETQYRALVEGSLQGVAIIDRHGVCQFANHAFVSMFGFASSVGCIGRKMAAIVADEERTRIAAYLEARLNGRHAPSRYEFEGRKLDGSHIWVETLVSVTEWKGAPASLLTCIDITERKQAEDLMRQSEERFRNLIEGALLGVLVLQGAKPVFVNAAYARLFGYEDLNAFLEIDNITEMAAPHERERLAGYIQARLRGEDAPTRYEYEGRRRDGETVWVECQVRMISWHGALAIQGMSIDITTRKRAELALQKSEERLSLIVRSTNDGVWDCDLTQGKVWWNDRYNELFGPRSTTTDNTPQWWRDHIHPDDREMVEKAPRKVVDAGGDHWQGEYRFRRGDGAYAYVIDRAYIGRDPAGQATRILGVISDITERKQAELALQESEVRFRDLVEGSIQGILILRNHRAVFANLAMARMLGYASPEALLQLNSSLDIAVPSERERLAVFTQKRLRDEAAPTHYEFQAIPG